MWITVGIALLLGLAWLLLRLVGGKLNKLSDDNRDEMWHDAHLKGPRPY
jgi:hypothetical protein